MGRKRILFVGGSINQTTMMHRIAEELAEHECAFSPLYAGAPVQSLARRGWLDFTTLGGQARRRTLRYLDAQGLAIDEGGCRGPYDLSLIHISEPTRPY